MRIEDATAVDQAWQAIDDNLYDLYQMAGTPAVVQSITDCWNALSAAHMKLTIDRLQASSMNFKSLTAKLDKTTKAINASLTNMKLGPEVISLFSDAATLATNAVKLVDDAKPAAANA
jgi:hypothetical protein